MANVFTSNPIVLDTFTSVIDVASSLGLPTGHSFKLNSIEWQTPTTLDHTCVITDAVSGNDVFNETCTTAKQSIIKYYHGALVKNLYIAASGVGSGKVLILLDKR